MGILNYSTKVPVAKTVGEIQARLVSHGASSVRVDYTSGMAVALSFLIATPFGERSYRLPANVEGVWRVLVQQNKAGQVPPRFTTKEQAARVAWRILRDWVSAQLAIIEAGMAELAQIMLPYMQADAAGHTVYEMMIERRLALPAGEQS